MATVAYFSMEFGLHEEFPSYSGGLGVLAGDFLKGAHDLGFPLVGVGLRWAEGYTTQRLDSAGEPVDEWHEHRPDFLEDTGVRVRVRVASRSVECPCTSSSRPTRGTTGSRAGSTIPGPTTASRRRSSSESAARAPSGCSTRR
jgi:starch phosphorylase